MLRRLEWTVLRRLDGILQGDYRTVLRGAGVDLADLREYQHHDDVRHIDWNVTARLQQPYVRQFIEDRDLTAWFLLDLSGSIDFGSTDVTKLALSAGFVATLARVITRHGNRVGAVLYGRKVEGVMPPGATRTHVLRLLQQMRRPRPVDAPLSAKEARKEAKEARARGAKAALRPGTRLGDLLQAAAGIVRRRSLVFIVSDFISEPGWAEALGRLARRHEVVAVRLVDPAEMALPDVGLVTVEDAETGEQLFVDASDPAFRARYAAIAQQREAELIEQLGRSGADILELATDEDLLEAMLRFVDLRRQRSRRRASPRFPATLRQNRAVPAGAGAPPAAPAVAPAAPPSKPIQEAA
ncbi:MAG: DUF58 domain-containing protein [Burkholderiales bacterium]|nr:DUF58 domain-containing protein [Burkholderiales bacterium]